MKSAQRPSGNWKELAFYRQVMGLCDVHAYLVVAEAVDHGNEESLKRGENRVEVISVCSVLFSNQYK